MTMLCNTFVGASKIRRLNQTDADAQTEICHPGKRHDVTWRLDGHKQLTTVGTVSIGHFHLDVPQKHSLRAIITKT